MVTRCRIKRFAKGKKVRGERVLIVTAVVRDDDFLTESIPTTLGVMMGRKIREVCDRMPSWTWGYVSKAIKCREYNAATKTTTSIREFVLTKKSRA